jgi:tetratricopeptide (TPR) repeat protein
LNAYEEFDELDSSGQKGFTLVHLVELEEKRGEIEEALRINEEVRSAFSKIGVHAEVARSFISRGRLLAKVERYTEARKAYEDARVILAQHNCGESLMKIIDEEVPDLLKDKEGPDAGLKH